MGKNICFAFFTPLLLICLSNYLGERLAFERLIFFRAARSFRRLGGSDGRRDGRMFAHSLARYRGSHMSKQRLATLRKEHSVCTCLRPFIIFSERIPTESRPRPLRIPTCSTSTFFGGLVFIFPPTAFCQKMFYCINAPDRKTGPSLRV